MKYTKRIYVFLGVIFVLSFLLALILPVDKIFKGVAATPAIAALIGALFQLFRDEAEFEKKMHLQRQEHIFNLGATSHMANIAFDKHVEFCEKYMKEVHRTMSELFAHGPSQKVDTHLGNLVELKKEYAAWLSEEITIQLDPFEKALNEIGALSGLSDSLGSEDQDARKNAIKKMYSIFREILNLSRDPEVIENSEIAAEIVKKKIRSILGVEELTKLRRILIKSALSFIEDNA